ncbi:MAG: TIGR03936 family radical SAM-associated protein [Lachnospiraceae bacterium]|nr:TIGR03936 family radical SAM-associated protein [Lachnospiraceae bacterium]
MKVRIKFSKHGVLKYIGHLDVMRYFQRAFRRANIDIKYSAGFSPHQIMSFAAPLGVGLESEGEYMDVELLSFPSSHDLIWALNEQMAEGIEIHNAVLLPDGTGNAMASVTAAGYYIDFRDGFLPPKGWEEAIRDFMAQEEILYLKKTEKTEREINLKEYIFDFRLSSHAEKDCLYLMVDASSSGNIKPAMVMEKMYEFLGGYAFDSFNLLITREDTYLNRGTKEAPDFAPLDQIGITVEEESDQTNES